MISVLRVLEDLSGRLHGPEWNFLTQVQRLVRYDFLMPMRMSSEIGEMIHCFIKGPGAVYDPYTHLKEAREIAYWINGLR